MLCGFLLPDQVEDMFCRNDERGKTNDGRGNRHRAEGATVQEHKAQEHKRTGNARVSGWLMATLKGSHYEQEPSGGSK